MTPKPLNGFSYKILVHCTYEQMILSSSGLNVLCSHKAPGTPHRSCLPNLQDQTIVKGKCMLLFSQKITNLVLSDYQAGFTSKLSLPMIQEPWAFPPRKENTEDRLNFWALWALSSASPWLARSSEFFNASALSLTAAL